MTGIGCFLKCDMGPFLNRHKHCKSSDKGHFISKNEMRHLGPPSGAPIRGDVKVHP